MIVKYHFDQNLYPGIILGYNAVLQNYLISTMTKQIEHGKYWKWPEQPDKIWYQHSDIVQKIQPPDMLNNRGAVHIKELDYLHNT